MRQNVSVGWGLSPIFLSIAAVAVLAFLGWHKVADAKRQSGCGTACILRGEEYAEVFAGMVYQGSIEDARKLKHHYDLLEAPPGRSSICRLIAACIGNDVDAHNWAIERMYGSKDFPTKDWINKVKKDLPDKESWFYATYVHLIDAVAIGTNNAAILQLQTSLLTSGVAENICDIKRIADVLNREAPIK